LLSPSYMIFSLSQISFVELQCITLKNIGLDNPPRMALVSLALSLQSFFPVVSVGRVVGVVYPSSTDCQISQGNYITFHPHTPKCIIIPFEHRCYGGGHSFLLIHWIMQSLPSSYLTMLKAPSLIPIFGM
jgi:hypothetical protein